MISVVPGFRFSALSAGVRKDGRIDVALAAADGPAAVAGVFTRNLVRAAPVEVALQRVRTGVTRAVLVNSGCANACTGKAGLDATLDSTAAVAQALGADPSAVLPASTGVIGAVLPAQRIVERAGELVGKLSSEGADDFAAAILTTDRWKKMASTALKTDGGHATLLAIGKGAGMIHPDVGPPHATMLVFLFTDALLGGDELQQALVAGCEQTFNACSVDGDTSTNDTVLALASGASGRKVAAGVLAEGVFEVCDALARSMVADGEGTNHTVELRVRGLATHEEARRVAKTVATSLLVKTALFGQDPNWGRLLAAAGRAGVSFDPSEACIQVGLVEIVRDGVGRGRGAEELAKAIMQEPSFSIELSLGRGPGSARYLTSDLGHSYVDVNAGYRS
ncbi:MAG TPA: bifunctional glutamate N-acetyltransferase/amino-acid acetyltransferase ArgJ [Polyangiaceae bacterium]|nr:bifunctional glutamate N-acetyltransferase/amino-acid acetyltransferase ArgJ [Polyangiaceae bacterium]